MGSFGSSAPLPSFPALTQLPLHLARLWVLSYPQILPSSHIILSSCLMESHQGCCVATVRGDVALNSYFQARVVL